MFFGTSSQGKFKFALNAKMNDKFKGVSKRKIRMDVSIEIA